MFGSILSHEARLVTLIPQSWQAMIPIKIIEHTLEDKVTPVETYSVRRRKGEFKYIWRLGHPTDAYIV